ncbi:MAG: replication initiator protein A [Eubacteriales bacterium]|nr:replication initiator protein A [Eubacteriales bacterium]
MKYLTRETEMPRYMICPEFLMEMRLPGAAKLVYLFLLDRARLSAVHPGYTDSNGDIFVLYPVRKLAMDTGKALSTVENALGRLEAAGLIERRKTAEGPSSHIYVKVPENGTGVPVTISERDTPRVNDVSEGGAPHGKTVPYPDTDVPEGVSENGTALYRNPGDGRTDRPVPNKNKLNKNNNRNTMYRKIDTGVHKESKRGIERTGDLDGWLRLAGNTVVDDPERRKQCRKR